MNLKSLSFLNSFSNTHILKLFVLNFKFDKKIGFLSSSNQSFLTGIRVHELNNC